MAWIPLSQVVSAMQSSLASSADTSTGFAVSELKVDLPAEVLTIGGQVVVQLPGQLDQVVPAKLAKLSFTLGATAAPEAKGPPSPWSKAYTGTLESLYAVAVSGERVLSVGRGGTILESKDSGASFLALPSGTSERLHAVAISSSGYALAVGHGGLLLRQESEGQPWSAVNLGFNVSLNAVATWGDSVLVAGGNGRVFVSGDGGQSWSNMQITNRNLHGVWGLTPNMVLVTGAQGGIWKGDLKNFGQVQSNVGKDLFGVWGAGPQQIYAVGHSGTILRSVDSGDTWQSLPSGTGENLYLVGGTGPGNVVAAGRNGAVLRSSDGTSFSPLQAGITEALHAVAGTKNGLVFTGTNGLVLAYRVSMNQ